MDAMSTEHEQRRKNVRLGLILASLAAAFFIGIIVRFAVLGH